MSDKPVEPPAASVRAGYEVRDADLGIVVAALIGIAVLTVILLVVLHGVYSTGLPEADGQPVVVPGESSVNERLAGVPSPRLEGLRELQADPPIVAPSGGVPGKNSPELHPEDLRADRQPRLTGYGWIDRGKGVARIPIDRAMDAVAAGRTGGVK